MNAKELIDKLSANPTSPLDLAATSAAALPIILRALRLLAAAEGGEGTALERLIEMKVMAPAPSGSGPSTVRTVVSVYLDDLVALEQRCAGLAARVRELEEERCCTCRDGALKQPYSTMPPLQTLPWGTEK